MTSGAFIVLLCACAVAARSVEYFPGGGLEVITNTKNMVEAAYYSERGGGISFTSEKLGEAEGLSIRNLRGDSLITVQHPNCHATLIKIMGEPFLLMNSTDGKRVEYAVPRHYAQQVAYAMENNYVPDEKLRGSLDKNSKYARERALEQLLAIPEFYMIKDAAFALGMSGVTGMENPAALVFYAIAKNLALFQEDSRYMHATGARYKRQSDCGGLDYCQNSDACCDTCPTTDICLGMCGPACSCWSFSCGDCCYWQGCYEHDMCCGVHGFYSFACLFPVSFTCGSYPCPDPEESWG